MTTNNKSFLKYRAIIDPAFVISVYAPENHHKQHPETANLLASLELPFYTHSMEDDMVAHHYVTDVLDHIEWPVVTVVSGADLIADWSGHQPERINELPAMRALHVKKVA